jgi:hypothetical protein
LSHHFRCRPCEEPPCTRISPQLTYPCRITPGQQAKRGSNIVPLPPRCCRNDNVFPVQRLFLIGSSQRRRTLLFEPLRAACTRKLTPFCASKQMSTLSLESAPPNRQRSGAGQQACSTEPAFTTSARYAFTRCPLRYPSARCRRCTVGSNNGGFESRGRVQR